MPSAPAGYGVILLNSQSQSGWAVVVLPGGAIALDPDGRLLMRLTEPVARNLAKTMTEALNVAPADPAS